MGDVMKFPGADEWEKMKKEKGPKGSPQKSKSGRMETSDASDLMDNTHPEVARLGLMLACKKISDQLKADGIPVRHDTSARQQRVIEKSDDAVLRGWAQGATEESIRREPAFYRALLRVLESRGMIAVSKNPDNDDA